MPAQRVLHALVILVAATGTTALGCHAVRRAALGAAPPGPLPDVPAGAAGGGLSDLVVGSNHACALRADARVVCWGVDGGYGQMGDGTLDAHATPAVVPGLHDIVALAASAQSTLALDRSGAVWCWGENDCGRPSSRPRPAVTTRPVRVPLPAAAAVFAGITTSCARLRDDTVRCWGDLPSRGGEPDAWGESWPAHVPQPTPLGGAAALTAQIGTVCAVVASGAVRCWGRSELDELLVPPRPAAFDATVKVGAPAARLASDVGVVCAALDDGKVCCWGYTATSFGAPPGSAGPVTLPLSGAREVVDADGMLCARDASGDVTCLGDRGLRRGGVTRWATPRTPTAMPALAGAIEISGAYGNVCALRADGSVRCAEVVHAPHPPGHGGHMLHR